MYVKKTPNRNYTHIHILELIQLLQRKKDFKKSLRES